MVNSFSFKKFKKESLTHLRMFAPAKNTLTSMPAQLIGTETVGTEVKNNKRNKGTTI